MSSNQVMPVARERESRRPGAVIELGDRREALSIPALERLMDDVLVTGHRNIVLQVPARTLIDNDALLALSVTARRAIARGAELSVVTADVRVRATLELCGLDGVEFFSSTKRALTRPRTGLIQRSRLRLRAMLERAPSGLSRSSSRARSR